MAKIDLTPEEKAGSEGTWPYEAGPQERYGGRKSWYEHPPGFCCETVRDSGRWPSYHMCGRKAAVTVGRLGFCKQHSPAAQRARREAREANQRAEYAEHDRAQAFEALGREAIAALRLIAAGHNDPRSLAQATLAEFDSKYPTPAAKTEEGFKL